MLTAASAGCQAACGQSASARSIAPVPARTPLRHDPHVSPAPAAVPMMSPPPTAVLVSLSGLPGVGKSSIGKALATSEGGAYLRIDTIEQALRECGTLAAGVHAE